MPDKELPPGSFTSSPLSQLGSFLWSLWCWASTLERGQMHYQNERTIIPPAWTIPPNLVKLCSIPSARRFPLGSAGWTSTAPSVDLAKGACSNNRRRGQLLAAACSYAGQVSPSVVSWAHPPACCHHQRGHSCSSVFSWGSKCIWKRSGMFQWCLVPATSYTHTAPGSSGTLLMAGRVMPGHSLDAPNR